MLLNGYDCNISKLLLINSTIGISYSQSYFNYSEGYNNPSDLHFSKEARFNTKTTKNFQKKQTNSMKLTVYSSC
jgi:hypothetical protein